MSRRWRPIKESEIPFHEHTIACMIAVEMGIKQQVAQDSPGRADFIIEWGWDQVALRIHNYDMAEEDHCRWWDFEKSEATDVEWDPGYAKLREASGHPVGTRRRRRRR